ncbi:thiamine phosphate synthase [Candidatus Hydrogenedentota bacterium]
MNMKLYLITDRASSGGRTHVKIMRAAIAAGGSCIQLRDKKVSDSVFYREALALRELTANMGVRFIVNDRIHVALAIGADGVHVGQDDMPAKVVRKLIGLDMILGVSTHCLEQAEAAIKAGADYIGVGPVYPTQTKEDVCAAVGLDYVRQVKENFEIPFVAIGGIKVHNVADVIMAGANNIAAVSEIVTAEDPGRAVSDMLTEIDKAMVRRSSHTG